MNTITVITNTLHKKNYELTTENSLRILLLQLDDNNYTTNLTVNLVGERAVVDVRAVGIASSGNKFNNTIQINHLAPNCTSNVLYKYVIKDAHTSSSWIGNVLIDTGAKGTVTYEENRNLLLTPNCRAISEPNLEILEGDIISAGHAAATGRFDDEQLFYLLSRGIDEVTAKRLVVEGFLLSSLWGSSGDESEELEQVVQNIKQAIERKLYE